MTQDRQLDAVTVLGSINMDTVFQVPSLPNPGETVMAIGVARHPGGKGANQAVAATRAGAFVRMVGAVGDDADGREMLALLAEEGIDIASVVVSDMPTGAAYITVEGSGENQIVVLSGANAAARAPVSVTGVRLAQLEVPVAVVAGFLDAPGDGTLKILNAAPFRFDALPLLALADIVVLNEIELSGYRAAAQRTDGPDIAARAGALRSHDAQTIIVTLGGAGSIAVGPEGSLFTSSAAVEVVDTTGAGDCFCGYLAARLASGAPITDAIADAHKAAALAVGRRGAAPSIPYRHELTSANPVRRALRTS